MRKIHFECLEYLIQNYEQFRNILCNSEKQMKDRIYDLISLDSLDKLERMHPEILRIGMFAPQ